MKSGMNGSFVARLRKFWFPTLASALLAIPILGMWELFRADRPRMVMTSGRSVGWEWDLASGRDYRFGDLQTMFGVQGDTWSGTVEEFFQCVHPEDRQRVSQVVADAKINHKPYEAEFRVFRRDGAVRWVTATGSFYYMKSGKPERMLGMVVDITEHKHAEEELKKSEEKISMAFRESPMALTLTSAKDHRYLMSTRPSNRAQVAPT